MEKQEKARYDKNYREKNKVKLTEIKKEYYKNNKSKLDKYAEDYRKKFPEKVKVSSKKSRIKNPESLRKASRSWNKRHPERKAEYARYYRKRKVLEVHARSLASKIKIPFNEKCELCKIKLAQERHHPNYNSPLEVMFLCIDCHRKVHYGRK